jgi:hypothetical protein
MKLIFRILLVLFLVSAIPVHSQDDLFRKERKRTWRKWRKNKQSYNPYLDKKAKNKPSSIIARGNKKDMRRMNRSAKKQMRHSKKRVNRKHR